MYCHNKYTTLTLANFQDISSYIITLSENEDNLQAVNDFKRYTIYNVETQKDVQGCQSHPIMLCQLDND